MEKVRYDQAINFAGTYSVMNYWSALFILSTFTWTILGYGPNRPVLFCLHIIFPICLSVKHPLNLSVCPILPSFSWVGFISHLLVFESKVVLQLGHVIIIFVVVVFVVAVVPIGSKHFLNFSHKSQRSIVANFLCIWHKVFLPIYKL